MLGAFINPRGYALDKVKNVKRLGIFPKAIYEFRLKKNAPLTFEMPDGTRYRPDQHLAETDMGSTPASLQLFLPKDEFLLSYIFHDSGYHHHGLYKKGPHGHTYVFHDMSRKDVDKLCLRRMIKVEGGGRIKVGLIYRLVRLCGGGPWKAGHAPDVVV